MILLDIPAGIWLTSNQRLHWRAKAERTAAIRALARVAARGHQAVTRVAVTVAVSYPTSRRADPSNAAPTVKAALDGITDAGVWPDDDSEHVVSVTYVRGETTHQRGLYRLAINLEEAD